MNTERYSSEQIFRQLREAWSDITGGPSTFTPETSVYRHMEADGSLEDFDPRNLELFFGFRCSQEDWTAFCRGDVSYKSPEWERKGFPSVTFDDLARFIAERAPFISFDPITILGRSCAPAGAFVGLQKLAASSLEMPRRIGPSTSIHHVLRGNKLERFWRQLQWRSGRVLPELNGFWRSVLDWTFIALVFSWLACWLIGALTKSLLVPSLLFAGMFLVFYAAKKIHHYANPLPTELKTFRDLAQWIAERRPVAT